MEQKTLEALELAHERILDHHKRQLPKDDLYTDRLGVELGTRWTPVASAGLYVPGGTASYPSSVLMNAVPAKVAGVKRMVMVVPSLKGELNPLVLVAAELAGVSEIYRVGGAQAVAALAYGTESISPVAKIVGPGNAYVAAAKRQVFGQVGIDMVAGPSEVVVIADRDNDPAWIASDLLAQAEHDTAAQADPHHRRCRFRPRGRDGRAGQLAALPRAATARASWQDFGAIILVKNLDEAPALADRLAPEHLEIATGDADALAARDARCRRYLHRPLYAGSDRRLCRRLQSRAADGAERALRLRLERARFHEAHLDAEARSRQSRRARTRGDGACGSRRPRRASALGRHQAQSERLGHGGAGRS